MHAVLFLLALALPHAEKEVPPPGAETAGHEKSNPLYQQLRDKGIASSEKGQAPLPAPRMADGLDAKAQTAVIKSLIGDDIDYDRFVEATVTAPFLLMPLGEVKGGNPETPVRSLDLYFVAHGPFKALTRKDVLERLGGGERNKGEGKTLSAEELKRRDITIPADRDKHEGYGYAVMNLLDKVELRCAGHSCWSETADSIVLAAAVDPRFNKDREYPNQWRSLEKAGEGGFKKGPEHSYQGGGYYAKITRLKEPEGGLFVECHILFTEPTGWFEGTNLLRSKLPSVAQGLARNFRQTLNKVGKGD